jgi:hypothetical protein
MVDTLALIEGDSPEDRARYNRAYSDTRDIIARAPSMSEADRAHYLKMALHNARFAAHKGSRSITSLWVEASDAILNA